MRLVLNASDLALYLTLLVLINCSFTEKRKEKKSQISILGIYLENVNNEDTLNIKFWCEVVVTTKKSRNWRPEILLLSYENLFLDKYWARQN